MIKQLTHRIKNSDFVRHVGTLSSGTLLAQIITLAAAPILTRLYGPESFAALAIFVAIISTMAPAAGGRYEVALVVTKEPSESHGLIILTLGITLTFSAIMLLALFFFHSQILNWMNASVLGDWIYLAPLGLFLTVFVTTWRNYANFQKKYLVISKIVVLQALFGTTLSITLGWLGFEQRGLIIANFFTLMLSSIFCVYIFRQSFSEIKKSSKNRIWRLAYKYREFPLISALPTFLNGFQNALPVFFLAKYYPEAIVGYYALMTRVVAAPLNVVSGAISQVNIKKTSEFLHKDESPFMYFLHLSALLVMIVILPTVIIFLYGPELFALFFGSQWREAGELLAILIPAFAVRFIASTLSGVFPATGHNKLASAWQVLAFLVTLLVFMLLANKLEVREMFYVLMIMDLTLYSLYYCFALISVMSPKEYA